MYDTDIILLLSDRRYCGFDITHDQGNVKPVLSLPLMDQRIGRDSRDG